MRWFHFILPVLASATAIQQSVLHRRQEEPTRCNLRELAMAALCDPGTTSQISAPASLADSKQMSTTWPKIDLRTKIEIASCACCRVDLTDKSALRVCNQAQFGTRVSYALLGLAVASVIEETECQEAPGTVQGRYIWEERDGEQRMAITIGGAQARMFNGLSTCANATSTMIAMMETLKS